MEASDHCPLCGNPRDKVGKIFDGLDAHINQKKKDVEQLASMVQVKLSGAFSAGSKEAYSLITQYNAQGNDVSNMQQQQINAIKDGNKLLGDISTKLDDSAKMNAIRLGAY